MSSKILLVGTGSMAQAYFAVLHELGASLEAVGRSAARAETFASATGAPASGGGIAAWLEKNPAPEKAIVATGVDTLEEVGRRLIEAGCRSLLLEKPGALDGAGIFRLALLASRTGASVWIGFNRRYYASVAAARKIVHEDGGISSAFFDFTELGYRIEGLDTTPEIKERWFFANSLHVVDLVFHFLGPPRRMEAVVAGGLPWHSSASRYAGGGICEGDVCFSYRADWDAPGRWKVELFTSKRRLVLSPMEQLRIQEMGSFVESAAELDDVLDRQFKPGLFREVEAWLSNDDRLACTIESMAGLVPFYEAMAGYRPGLSGALSPAPLSL